MSANQKIPKGPLAIAVFFMLLFLIQVIVVASARSMPSVFFILNIIIGGTSLILGIIIYIYLYRKYKIIGYSKPTVSGEAITLDISDKKLFRGHLIAGIGLIIVASMLFGLYWLAGVALLLPAIFNFIIYGIKPEKLRQKYLDKATKKAAKKGT